MYIKYQTTQKMLLLVTIAGLSMTSCEKSDNGGNAGGEIEAKGGFFLSVSGESKEYILRSNDLEKGEIQIGANIRELTQTGYAWSFDRGTAVGLAYRQNDPGLGLAFKDENGNLKQLATFEVRDRFTSYGFFKDYFITSVGGQNLAEEPSRNDGATFIFRKLSDYSVAKTKTIKTIDLVDKNKGELATFSGIIDRGNGEFLTGLVVSGYNRPGPGNGSSTGTISKYDSIWVAAFDEDLNLKRMYRSDKLGYSSGRFRSQYYSQLGKADNGDVYVFSGHFESESTKPAGALRIKKDATEFDSNYFFNIEEKSNGYKFRRVYHITGNQFLLEFYNDKTIDRRSNAVNRFAIVDAGVQSFVWVTNIPDHSRIVSTGLACPYKGKIYLPVTVRGEDPAIYVIDPQTTLATKGLVIKGATGVNAVGRITE